MKSIDFRIFPTNWIPDFLPIGLLWLETSATASCGPYVISIKPVQSIGPQDKQHISAIWEQYYMKYDKMYTADFAIFQWMSHSCTFGQEVLTVSMQSTLKHPTNLFVIAQIETFSPLCLALSPILTVSPSYRVSKSGICEKLLLASEFWCFGAGSVAEMVACYNGDRQEICCMFLIYFPSFLGLW